MTSNIKSHPPSCVVCYREVPTIDDVRENVSINVLQLQSWSVKALEFKSPGELYLRSLFLNVTVFRWYSLRVKSLSVTVSRRYSRGVLQSWSVTVLDVTVLECFSLGVLQSSDVTILSKDSWQFRISAMSSVDYSSSVLFLDYFWKCM